MEKSIIFEKELNFIKNLKLRDFAKEMIERLPDYFFEIPASSTGKYHPGYAQNKGGLVRHTQASVRIAKELFRNNTVQNLDDIEKDIVIISLLLHDGLKNGENYQCCTAKNHPLQIVNFIKEQKDITGLINAEILNDILGCIASHMGEWNTDNTGERILPIPRYNTEKFVHLCDYLASRKLIEINFEV